MKADIFKGLNAQQKAAVSYTEGPSIILAGAGSGKTRVLIHKVLHLIHDLKVDPSSIIMITFTNKAAGEMKKRIALQTEKKLGYVGTFHSFCAMVLRKEGRSIGIPVDFTIYDDDDQQTLIKHILKEKDIKKYTASYIANRISTAKNVLVGPERYLRTFQDYSGAVVCPVYEEYEKRMKKNDAVDFDDLILKTVQLFIRHDDILDRYQNKFSHIFVDEFQDTNYAQYTFTRKLSEKNKMVTVVGDFSQSIYSWRGADIRNLEKFQDDFKLAKVFNLEVNYRSTQRILDYAFEIISKNEGHPILKLRTENLGGEDVIVYEAHDEQDEAFYVVHEIEKLKYQFSYQNIAVLYRTNAQSRVIEEAFLHYNIPYTLIGGTRFYERKEVKDILSYLRLLVNPIDEVSKDRVEKLGKRRFLQFADLYKKIYTKIQSIPTIELMEQIFASTNYLDLYSPDDPEDFGRLENIKELKSVAGQYPDVVIFLQQVALVESEYSEGEKKRRNVDGVRLMTLHQAKGLEFSAVFIVGLEDGILPHSRSIDDFFQLEEERRLFYVGVTRAQYLLYITHARRRYIFGKRGETVTSRFIGG
ncbi:ATP-dependent DNA helicase PcrA [Candidatus Roizmanbacteria bacterium CG_4_10_14_0_8_um_filter_39_9]|uniref:DNA 3'-5' helicase n=1 Tax=Candidatus Roizmanbacteria bacterium CG_4_10_14_0_8_um_filter_39_9 TaxID=1974829 RepID=A0A2M7QCB8_9BACT|nr:MAG: ATP-dependent DNA helicase PcrA [Candidatus Roizmanbacteria bacterium CG_4_10_14_0_8_um_filter_39_9]